MNDTYYFAAYTDSECLLGCDHQHRTIASAVACVSCAGGYVVAVENGQCRALTDAEEKEFQEYMYGVVDKKLEGALTIPIRLDEGFEK